MPLIIKEQINCGTQLGIWKKEENPEALKDVFPLKAEEKEQFNRITHPNRQAEWLISRILLTELLGSRKIIEYNENKKPEITNSPFRISISHSKNFVAILISETIVPGIDIEHISDRVNKVKHKFLSEDELTWSDSNAQMTACWGAKEAVFKIYEKELDFKDIRIEPFVVTGDGGRFNATVIKNGINKLFTIRYRMIEDDMLTYTLLED